MGESAYTFTRTAVSCTHSVGRQLVVLITRFAAVGCTSLSGGRFLAASLVARKRPSGPTTWIRSTDGLGTGMAAPMGSAPPRISNAIRSAVSLVSPYTLAATRERAV